MAVNGRTIVDAQVHLWKAESEDWKWVPGRKPQLPEPFTIEKLVPLMDEAGVDRVVIVPPSWPGDRNDYGLEAAQALSEPLRRHGPHSAAGSEVGEAAAEMEGAARHARRAADLHARAGALLTSGAADWFWPAAEKAGLPVMFLAPDNMPKFAPIAERHPGLHADHRPHEPDAGDRQGAPHRARHRRRGGAGEISERFGQAVVGADLFARALSVARHDRASSSAASTPSVRGAATGAPTSPTPSPSRPTASASPTSPRN